MANKKNNKKSNKKSTKKANNNKYNKNNNNYKQKATENGQKSRETSIDLTIDSVIKTLQSKANSKANTCRSVDVFGDSDKRLDLRTNPENSCQTISASNEETAQKAKTSSATSVPKGLTNLGNTCYLNSVLQIISETKLLYDLMNERSNDGYAYRAKSLKNVNDWSVDKPFDEELEITLGQCLPLSQSLIQFMREMRTNNSRTISPTKLLRDIRKEWTQFDGWAQQDSHELLRCLLDSLKCKEVIRQRKAIMADFKTQSTRDDNNLDDDTKARIKSFAAYSHITPIDSVFGGQLLSSVCCDVCLYTNLIFEPFFDLSLPLTHLTNNTVIEKNKSKLKDNKNTSAAVDQQSEDNNLLEKDPKSLSPKDRKNVRQQKKAAKREAKQQKRIVIQTQFKEKSVSNDESNERKEEMTNGCKDTEEKSEEQKNTECEDKCNTESEEEWIIEPLLSDFNETVIPVKCLDSDNKAVYEVDANACEAEEGDGFGFGLLFDNDNEETIHMNGFTQESDNEWNENGWVFQPNHQMIGCLNIDQTNGWNGWDEEETKAKPNDVVANEEGLGSDELKAQEIDFNCSNGSLDLESELYLLSISDREKLELKQTTDPNSDSTQDFTPNYSPKRKQIIAMSLETIDSTKSVSTFDLMKLLSNFTSIESLSGSNKYLCEMCTKNSGSEQKTFTNASKRALIALPPPVLTLHLKRFEADGYRRAINLRKISTFVSFPATFDLAPFVSKMYNYLTPITGHRMSNALIYSLYGVVEHSGSLRSGHYTAYVKLRTNTRNLKKFAILEPFVPKVDNVLNMIEHKFFGAEQSVLEEDNTTQPNGMTNGYHSSNGFEDNTSAGDESKESNGDITAEDEDSYGDCGKWFHISDSSVSSSSLSSVLRSQAYILFYERIA